MLGLEGGKPGVEQEGKPSARPSYVLFSVIISRRLISTVFISLLVLCVYLVVNFYFLTFNLLSLMLSHSLVTILPKPLYLIHD